METLWLAVLLYIAVAVACFTIAIAVLWRPVTTGERVASMLGHAPSVTPKRRLRLEPVLQALSRALPRSERSASLTRRLLVQAGRRDDKDLMGFYGCQVVLAIGTAGLLTVTGIAASSPILVPLSIVFAFVAPKLALKRMVCKRQRAIQLALPDALDLTTICVEAGLGLNGALARVTEEMRFSHAALSEEFSLVNLEMRAGKARAEALRNLGERTGVEDIRSFVAVLVQTDRFGTSIANTLRVYSDSLRTERRQRAEEAAAKTTIKLVPVLVLCIMPALFCVTVGPAVLQLMRTVFPALQGQ